MPKIIENIRENLLAEAMLTWTIAGRSFEEISSVLLQLFEKKGD